MPTKTATEKVAAIRAAEAFALAKDAADAAAEALAAARDDLLAVLDGATGTVSTSDGTKVVVGQRNTRVFDVALLADLVPAETFAFVTVPKVDPALFDAAVRLDDIPAEVIASVVAVQPVTTVVVKR